MLRSVRRGGVGAFLVISGVIIVMSIDTTATLLSAMRVTAGALVVSAASLAVAPAAAALPGEQDNALMKLQLFSDHGEHDALCEAHAPAAMPPVAYVFRTPQ